MAIIIDAATLHHTNNLSSELCSNCNDFLVDDEVDVIPHTRSWMERVSASYSLSKRVYNVQYMKSVDDTEVA